MLECRFCHNISVDNYRCHNCGVILGSYEVACLKNANDFQMTVSDKYIIFNEGDPSVSLGAMVSSAAGGFVGTKIYDAVMNKKYYWKIGMIDLNSIRNIEIVYPESRIQGGAIHIYFKNGKDYVFCVREGEFNKNKIYLPRAIETLRRAGLYIAVRNVPKLKRADLISQNPFYKKPKHIFLTVSSSAAAFIKPFKEMIVAE